MQPDLVKRRDAAERLGVSEATIRRLIRKGELTEVRVTPDCPRVRVVDIDRLVSSGGAR